MRAAAAGALVILLALAAAPASAQLPDPQVTPPDPTVVESDREIVLTVSKSTPGRVVYRTSDESARAPADYGAVSDEMVFTEPGSKTVAIRIIDDDIVEGTEVFSFEAYEGDDAAGWPTGRFVTVRITDDEGPAFCWYPPCASDETGEPAATPATTATTAVAGPSSPGPVTTAVGRPPAVDVAPPPPTTALPPTDVEVEVAPEDLLPGPGFELTTDGTAGPMAGRGGGGRGSAPELALGLTGAGVTAGGVGWVRRRRRWSVH